MKLRTFALMAGVVVFAQSFSAQAEDDGGSGGGSLIKTDGQVTIVEELPGDLTLSNALTSISEDACADADALEKEIKDEEVYRLKLSQAYYANKTDESARKHRGVVELLKEMKKELKALDAECQMKIAVDMDAIINHAPRKTTVTDFAIGLMSETAFSSEELTQIFTDNPELVLGCSTNPKCMEKYGSLIASMPVNRSPAFGDNDSAERRRQLAESNQDCPQCVVQPGDREPNVADYAADYAF